jgi:hypothetical protein
MAFMVTLYRRGQEHGVNTPIKLAVVGPNIIRPDLRMFSGYLYSTEIAPFKTLADIM